MLVRNLVLALISIFPLLGISQPKKNITVIDQDIYKSYFDIKLKEPVMVVYKLYQGGGDCDRSHFHFKNDMDITTATTADYAHTGYDQGHLANAEDFAYDCVLDEKTFRFYNCVPQKVHLNRGCWKSWETNIREESQEDSLLVLTGSVFGSEVIGDHVYVPTFCWKVVQSLSTKKILHVIWCDNTDEAQCNVIDLKTLRKKVKYKLPIKK